MNCTPVQTLYQGGILHICLGYSASSSSLECQAPDQIESIICTYFWYWSELCGQIELSLVMKTTLTLSVSNWFKADRCTQWLISNLISRICCRLLSCIWSISFVMFHPMKKQEILGNVHLGQGIVQKTVLCIHRRVNSGSQKRCYVHIAGGSIL